MIAHQGQDERFPVSHENGAYVPAGSYFVATGLELAQAEPAMGMRAAKCVRHLAQPLKQIGALAGGQRGDLRGGAAGLQNAHR